MQWYSYLVPLRYAIEVLRRVVLEGQSFIDELLPFLVLVGIGVALLASASLTLKERE